MVFTPRSKSDVGPVRRDPIWKQKSPPIPSRKVHLPRIPSYHAPADIGLGAGKRRGSLKWVKKIFTGPVEAIAALVRKCYPSDDCLRCVKCTNWLVLIVGGIVGAIVAIVPKPL
jgi:hypothetical protein